MSTGKFHSRPAASRRHGSRRGRSPLRPGDSRGRLAIERLEDRLCLASTVHITAAWLAQQGAGPYLLTASDTTYILDTDVTVNGTAFVIGGKNITLDLNQHSVTYGAAAPLNVVNGGFEQGSGRNVTGWDLSAAPDAALGSNDYYLFGNNVLRFTNITGTESVLSDAIAIPAANREYTATITPQGPFDAAVTLSVIDAVTGLTLASGSVVSVGSGRGAAVSFVPTTTNPVRLRISATPARGRRKPLRWTTPR